MDRYENGSATTTTTLATFHVQSCIVWAVQMTTPRILWGFMQLYLSHVRGRTLNSPVNLDVVPFLKNTDTVQIINSLGNVDWQTYRNALLFLVPKPVSKLADSQIFFLYDCTELPSTMQTFPIFYPRKGRSWKTWISFWALQFSAGFLNKINFFCVSIYMCPLLLIWLLVLNTKAPTWVLF